MQTYPQSALNDYREAVENFVRISDEYRSNMPHPASLPIGRETYTFDQWDAVLSLVVAPARAKIQALETEFPGIGDAYEETRFRFCQAAEDARFEEEYR